MSAPGHGARPDPAGAPVHPAQAGSPLPPAVGPLAGYPYPLYYPAAPVTPYPAQTPPHLTAVPVAGVSAGYPYPVHHPTALPVPPAWEAQPEQPAGGPSAQAAAAFAPGLATAPGPATAPVPDAPAGASLRRPGDVVRKVVREGGLFLLCLLAGFVSLGFILANEEALTGHPMRFLPALGLMATALAVLAALSARRRWPIAVTVASSLAGLFTGLDTTVGLVAMTTVVRRAGSVRDPVPWVVGLLLAAGTWRALSSDAGRAATASSMLGILAFEDTGGVGVIHGSVPPALTLILITLPVATGLLLRARDSEQAARLRVQDLATASAQAERTAQEQAMVSSHLADRVDLQEERERVAREVHDGLGHRLSLLALHAAALEAASEPDGSPEPGQAGGSGGAEDGTGAGAAAGSVTGSAAGAVGGTQEAARLVREEAETAMRDLRSLLAVLREPVGAAEPAPSLADLADMVDDVLAAQQPISSSSSLSAPTRLTTCCPGPCTGSCRSR